MAHPHSGDVNLVPTDVINAGLPAAQQGPDIAALLAQTAFGDLASIQRQLISSQASKQAASTQAGATIGAAGIGAQSRVDAQLIATNGAIAQNNAQMKTDAVLAGAGDIAAYRRLLQEQQYDAQLQNNKNKMEIARLAGSGSLFDNIAARFAAAGKGALPEIGGAFGLGGGIQEVTAPTGNAPLSIQEILSFVPQTAPQQSSGGFDFSSLAGLIGGGSGGSVGNFDLNIGDLFTDVNKSVFDAISEFPGSLFVDTPAADTQTASAFTSGITGDPVASAKNTQSAFEALLANPDAFLHGGGPIKKGESAVVGDDAQGRLTPFSELVKNTSKGVEIIPLNKFRGAFADGTGDHATSDTTDPDGVLSDLNNLPALQALRGNPTKSIFSFGGPDFFSRPKLGIDPLPSPFDFGKNFLTSPPDQQQDVLNFFASQFFGEGRQGLVRNLFQQSQPGHRNFPRAAFGF